MDFSNHSGAAAIALEYKEKKMAIAIVTILVLISSLKKRTIHQKNKDKLNVR